MAITNGIIWCVLLATYVGLAGGPPLVPLGDPVTQPLLPAWINSHDVRISGQLAYLWKNDSSEHVIHIVGDFEIKMGQRTLRAQQGVVWMSTDRVAGRDYRSFDVFLFRDATITEPGGTISEGPVLVATLSSTGDVYLSADRQTNASSADTAIFRDAAAVRSRILAGSIDDGSDTSPRPRFPATKREAPLPPELYFSAAKTSFSTLPGEQRLVTCIGDVNLFRGGDDSEKALELRADAAVIFLRSDDDAAGDPAPKLRGERSELFGSSGVEAVYLEGDIRMSFGDRRVRASRLYYDMVHDRAMILDAVVFGPIPDRDVSLYVRASRIRQLSMHEFTADDAQVTTSEFHTPHYHIGAQRVELADRTARWRGGERSGPSNLHYKMRNATFNLYNVPLLYWPVASGDARFGDSALRGVRIGADNDFGALLKTEWDLFNLLSLGRPKGVDAEFSLDYFGRRGPAAGVDIGYERDNFFGLYRAYVIDDRGDDNLGRFRDNTPDTDIRGRMTMRHRQYLPDGWELTIEQSYLSDRAFLEEYFENEFDQEKDQENLIYAVKRRDNWAFTALAQVRLNDFLTQTERLPDFGLRIVGQPVGDVATWFSENRAGVVRYRAGKKDLFLLLRRGSDGPSSGSTARVDSRQEIEFPLDFGPVRVVPFVSVRGTMWDDSLRDGGLARGFATYGLRGSMYLSRVYDNVRSDLFDIDGVRHIIKPQIVAWGSVSNRRSDELFPFDSGVERLDDTNGVAIGVRQRWQTKRGAPDRRRTVDWINLDFELGLFDNNNGRYRTNGFASFSRPEESIARNYVNADFMWRLNDSTALLSELNYDINDGELDVANVSLTVDRTPRFSYLLGYRFIEETDSNLLGFGMNYRIDEKHTLAFREQFDIGRGETLDFTVGYIRKFPRWYVGVTFELDEAEDVSSISLSIWPEGLPRASLGSRRFSRLGASTAISRN